MVSIRSMTVTAGALLFAILAGAAGAAPPAADTSWRDGPIWHDGKAEYAVYDATRVIYGETRSFEAALITNSQHMDPRTTTKAADADARESFEVFKHNLREVAPTDNYDYKYLTTVFVHADDLAPYKLTMSSQEDCGASFKNVIVERGRIAVDSFVYFPDAGSHERGYKAPRHVQFYDALTLTLRDYAVGHDATADESTWSIPVIPEQTSNRETSFEPVDAVIEYLGVESLELPIGTVRSHRFSVSLDEGARSDFWFADDRAHPEWRRALVKYDGFDGVKYALKSYCRWAYWE